jgi:hypothetical protein
MNSIVTSTDSQRAQFIGAVTARAESPTFPTLLQRSKGFLVRIAGMRII